MTLSTTRLKIPHRCINNIPESQISIRFALLPAFFEIQAILRQTTPKWPWTLQDQRCSMYELAVSLSPKFHSVLLYDQPFSRYHKFYISPIDYHVKQPKKNKNKTAKKVKISNFAILLKPLVEFLPRGIHEFGRKNQVHTSEKMFFETFTPIWWSHVNENEQNLAKLQNLKIHNSFNNFGRDPP